MHPYSEVNDNVLLKELFQDLLPLFDQNILDSNPHIKYGKGKIYGVALAEFEEDNARVTFVEIDDVSQKDVLPQPSRSVFYINPGKGPTFNKE